MNDSTTPSLEPVLCDLGGTHIRFAVENEFGQLVGNPKIAWKKRVRLFQMDDKVHPFWKALRVFEVQCAERSVTFQNRELRLSLPTDELGDVCRFPNLKSTWGFNRLKLKRDFGFKEVRLWNDADAAVYGLFELIGHDGGSPFDHLEIVANGSAPPSGSMLLLNVGTGLGTAIGRLNDNVSEQVSRFWVPEHCRFGSVACQWDSEAQSLLDMLRRNEGSIHTAILERMDLPPTNFATDQFQWREFLLSGPGLARLYHALQGTIFTTSNIQTVNVEVEGIVTRAKDGDVGSVAALKLFCRLLGQAAGELAASKRAFTGLYLCGAVLRGIGWRGLHDFGFVSTFAETVAASAPTQQVPIFLITHLYPELVGLSRFSPLG